MASKIEIFQHTNAAQLEQAVNEFLQKDILVHQITQSQSSYLLEDPDTDLPIPHTELTITIFYLERTDDVKQVLEELP